MESAGAAHEAVPVGEDAAPGLADEAGADQVHWLVRGEAHEDLLDELLRQRRRHASRRWVGIGGIETTARTYVGSESLYIYQFIWHKNLSNKYVLQMRYDRSSSSRD